MAASLFAANKGYFDDLDVKRVLAFESGLHGWLKDRSAALLSRMESERALSKESEAELTTAIEAFKKTFA
jgi:F-type H+-transporting ATPase subunit alpha